MLGNPKSSYWVCNLGDKIIHKHKHIVYNKLFQMIIIDRMVGASKEHCTNEGEVGRCTYSLVG